MIGLEQKCKNGRSVLSVQELGLELVPPGNPPYQRDRDLYSSRYLMTQVMWGDTGRPVRTLKTMKPLGFFACRATKWPIAIDQAV